MKRKVALGMSGGVDSSVCAHLLVEQGYDVTGVYLECWRAPGCRSEEDRADALKVALSLGIPFQVLDFKETYKNEVVEYFFKEYAAGRTPNPDVLCNKEIKFGLFYDWAMKNGFDAVATGHYAKILELSKDEEDTLVDESAERISLTDTMSASIGKELEAEIKQKYLAIPKDTHKDQTYFLYLLKQEQLAYILFPLADYTKPEVRKEAEKRGLHVATKKDSVGICFIGDINVHQFLKDRLGENPGDVVDVNGTVIGRHQGLWFYTVGQRHGFTVNKKSLVIGADGEPFEKENIPPFYVIQKIPDKNQLMVGFGAQTYLREFKISPIHWISHMATTEKVLIRIRHTGQLLPGKIIQSSDTNAATIRTKATIILDEPTQGIAEGQSVVIYSSVADEILCLGGAIIS